MRILWVKAGGLVPADSGGKIRSFNILRQLAEQHSVTLFSFHAADENDRQSQLGNIFHRVVCVPLQLPHPKSLIEIGNYGLSLFSSQPYSIAKFCRPQVRLALQELLEHDRYDVIVCDFLVAAGVIPWDLPTPKVLFTHNVEAIIWRRHYEVAGSFLWKAVSCWEWRRMESAERCYLKSADHVLAVSDSDRDVFARIVDSRKISVIPTGVDVEFFQPKPGTQAGNSLVFTGSMDWLPNEDAMIYFIDEMLPLIKRECPDVRLAIVGRNPSDRLKTLAKKYQNIEITGRVEDIRPHIVRAAVCIVPLRIGGGTRLKIFEAMAMGKAVVSTSIGAEGLPVSSGENIVVSDHPQDFANSVLSLLHNQSERKRIGDAARKLVEENYGWKRVGRIFASTLEEVIAQPQSLRR